MAWLAKRHARTKLNQKTKQSAAVLLPTLSTKFTISLLGSVLTNMPLHEHTVPSQPIEISSVLLQCHPKNKALLKILFLFYLYLNKNLLVVKSKPSSKCSSTTKPRPHCTPKVQTLVLNILWMDFACSLKNKLVNKHAHIVFSPIGLHFLLKKKKKGKEIKQVHKWKCSMTTPAV